MTGNSGGVIRLTCGGIGTGKSYLNVKLAEEAKATGKYKKIYSNIRAHSELAEGITPMPDDWRDCETDSLVIIDEIQMHEKFSKHFSSRRDSEIADLSMIRHNRLDIWMISPNPALVNSDVRNLVTQYYWLESIGKTSTKCFCFGKVYNSVSKTIKNQAYDEFTYSIEEKYYSLYKSTKDGVASGRNYNRNIKLMSFILGLIVVCLIIVGLMFYLTKSTKDSYQDMQTKEQSKKPQTTKEPLTNSVLPVFDTNECRKGINVDKPECVAYFNALTDNKSSVSDTSVKYDPSKPYEQDEIQSNLSYQITSKPVFSGCMKQNGRYVAYTQQGTIIKNVSSTDCQRLIDNNDRPFNYFQEPQQAQSSNLTAIANVPDPSPVEPVQYATNYVEPHLQARVVN